MPHPAPSPDPKHVTTPTDLPPGEHFAIIEYRVRYNEDYGVSSPEKLTAILLCPTREAWEAEIARRTTSSTATIAGAFAAPAWRAAVIRVPVVSTAVTVSVG